MADEPTVPSPCVRICTLSADGTWCLGCYRTLEEIMAWSGLDNAGKQAVLAAAEARMAAAFDAPRD